MGLMILYFLSTTNLVPVTIASWTDFLYSGSQVSLAELSASSVLPDMVNSWLGRTTATRHQLQSTTIHAHTISHVALMARATHSAIRRRRRHTPHMHRRPKTTCPRTFKSTHSTVAT